MNSRRVGLVAILLITILIYSPLRSAPPLTWDDGSNIFNNPFFTLHMWRGVWTNAYYGLYVPVTSSVWALLFYLGGGESWPFRALNLGLHLANIVLLYRMLSALTRRWTIESASAALLATALFAFHPLQVETVAWISGGRDLLAAFFALGTIALYFRFPSRAGYMAASVAFVLALLSKPNTVILPLAIVYMDWFFATRPARSSFKRVIPWLALSLVAIYLTELAQGEHFEDTLEWWSRPQVTLEYLAFYIGKFLWPHPLSGNYAFTPEAALAQGWFRPGVVVVTLAGGYVAAYKWNRRYFLFALFFILLLPVSGLIPFGYERISGVADHYMYLPLTAIAAVAMLPLSRLPKRALALPFALCAAMAYAAFARTDVWKSDQAFFTDMAKTSPDAYSTALGMSVVMCEDLKNFDEGLNWIDRALKARPDDILALANRAFCLLNSNRNAEVLRMDLDLERLNHDEMAATQPTAYSSLISSVGTAMIKEGEYGMGFQYLCEAYRILPGDQNHVNNLNAAAEILKAHGLNPVCKESLFED